MIPRITETGIREAAELLAGVAHRTRDATPAFELIVDDIFDFERNWWQFTYGTQRDKEQRPGRDPRYMVETGSLERSATRRGGLRQTVDAGADFAFVGVTSGLAEIHEGLGRPVLGTPGPHTVNAMLERLGTFILTGHGTRGSNLWLN